MLRRHGARDLEDPHEFARCRLAIAHVVQRGFGRIRALPHAIGDQRVQARAFVHFVEVRQRRFPHRARGRCRRAFTGGRSTLFNSPSARSEAGARSFSPADTGCRCVAAEVVGDAQRRDVHLALFQDLGVGQLGFGIGTGGSACPCDPARRAPARASPSLVARMAA
jgi:hypothetical protein